MKLHRINALLLKYFYITINRYDRLFDVIYWPVMDIILWGFASYFIEDISNVNILSMLLGGVILWTFVWRSSQDIAVFVLEDFWSRSLYHVFSSPVKISEHLTSVILVGFIRSLATFGVLTVLSILIYSFNIFTLPLMSIVFGATLLSMFGWSMGLFITSMILRFGKRIQVLAWSLVWIMQPFSCVFYPITSLPEWAQPVAKLMPITYVFEHLRSALYDNVINYSQLWYTLFANIVLILLTSWFVSKSFDKARTTGLLATAD